MKKILAILLTLIILIFHVPVATASTENINDPYFDPTNTIEKPEEKKEEKNSEENKGTENQISSTNSSITQHTQENNSESDNNTTGTADTGNNDASKNTGTDNAISTGDANVTGTSINHQNTNLENVKVAELNIPDGHTGDIELDFEKNCIFGCDSQLSQATDSSTTTIDHTNQQNEAILSNQLDLSANSGKNTADMNTGGDNTIRTGDANASGNMLSFLNNNVEGEIYYGIINIFGDFEGDILLPEIEGCERCITNQSIDTTKLLNQNNDALIENEINADAKTGDNKLDFNTGGNNSLDTGETNVDINTINVANSNEGSWWLVIVNKAGEWIGKIIGASSGATMAGSEGVEIKTDEKGNIHASTEGSQEITEDISTTNVTEQTNNTQLENILNFSANTGENSASYNTGGDNTIQTGDANIIANIVNFVNNNISKGEKLVVTVVNVFGKWVGNVIPGAHAKDDCPKKCSEPEKEKPKEEKREEQPPVGGEKPKEEDKKEEQKKEEEEKEEEISEEKKEEEKKEEVLGAAVGAPLPLAPAAGFGPHHSSSNSLPYQFAVQLFPFAFGLAKRREE